VSKGHILGIEDAILGKSDFYTTSAVVHSQEEGVELYRIESDTFCNLLKQTSIWNELVKKATHYILNCEKSLKMMERSNKLILDKLRSKNVTELQKPTERHVSKFIQLLEEIEKVGPENLKPEYNISTLSRRNHDYEIYQDEKILPPSTFIKTQNYQSKAFSLDHKQMINNENKLI